MKPVLKDDSVSFLSFDPDGSQSSYKLHALDHQIIQKVKDTLEKLDQIPQVYLCARGDCFRTPDAHDNFINKELATLFIVGEKARSNLKPIPENGIGYYKRPLSSSGDIDDLDQIKDELKTLIKECNKMIKSKHNAHCVRGKISKECIDFILGHSQTVLERWTIFFLSFLHNSGNPKTFKLSSPFLSLTYGDDKREIAQRFALERCKHDRGIVFIYSLKSKSR